MAKLTTRDRDKLERVLYHIRRDLATRDTGLLREMAELSAAVFRERFPINNETAEKVWRFSNSNAIPASLAARFMESLGYVPFQGFPLQRKAIR